MVVFVENRLLTVYSNNVRKLLLRGNIGPEAIHQVQNNVIQNSFSWDSAYTQFDLLLTNSGHRRRHRRRHSGVGSNLFVFIQAIGAIIYYVFISLSRIAM